MSKKQILGALREVLMALGAGLITFGFLKEGSDITTAVGAIMSIVSFVWAITVKDAGKELLLSMFRKTLSAVGGALIAYGIVSPETVAAFTAIILPVISLFSSYGSNKETGISDKKDGVQITPRVDLVLLFLIAPALLFLGGCSLKIDPESGAKEVIVDGPSIIEIFDNK